MKLYIVTIRGFKYYFSGDLTPDGIIAIENFCLKLGMDGKSANAATLFERLRNYITSELDMPITSVKIEHVFRVNY